MHFKNIGQILLFQLLTISLGNCADELESVLPACASTRPEGNYSVLNIHEFELPAHVSSSNESTNVRFLPSKLNCTNILKLSLSLVLDPAQKSNGTFGPDGVFFYNSEYFWNTQYCIYDITKTKIKLKVCEIPCSGNGKHAICVHKCCPFGKSFDIENLGTCTVSKSVGPSLWRPQVYHGHSVLDCVKDGNTSEACVHGDIPLEDFHYTRFNPTCQEGAHVSPYFSHEEPFGFVKNSTLYLQDSILLRKHDYCLDEAFDEYGNTTHILLACGCPELPENRGVSILYVVGMCLSAFFLFSTIVVYCLVWSIHNIHGWTVFSLSVSMFFMMIYLGTSRSMQLTMYRDELEGSPACFFVSFTTHFFFLSTFCWLTTLSFDLWWTFRSLAPVSGRSKGLERYMYYAMFAIGFPIFVVALGLMLDRFSDKNDLIIPGYGRETCFIGDPTSFRYWVVLPVGLLLFFNLLFFGTTIFIMYQYHKNTEAVRANSQNQRQTAVLFAKLFVVMGVTWSFEIIENLSNQKVMDDKGCEIQGESSWIWIIPDLINLFQGLAIFVIFVCKRQILIHLWRKQEFLRVCLNPIFRLECCKTAQQDLERTGSASGAKTTHSTVSMRQLSTHRSLSISEA